MDYWKSYVSKEWIKVGLTLVFLAFFGLLQPLFVFADQVTISAEVPSVCGDGILDAAKQCDGQNLAGQTCSTQGFSAGSLSCTTDCHFDTSKCTVNNNPVSSGGGNGPVFIQNYINNTISAISKDKQNVVNAVSGFLSKINKSITLINTLVKNQSSSVKKPKTNQNSFVIKAQSPDADLENISSTTNSTILSTSTIIIDHEIMTNPDSNIVATTSGMKSKNIFFYIHDSFFSTIKYIYTAVVNSAKDFAAVILH